VCALAVGILGHETDAVTNLKSFGVGQGDLLIPMITVHDEFGGDGRLLEEHGILPAPEETDFRLKKNRVAQPIRPRQYADRAASTPRYVIDRGLDHSICGADKVGLLGADCDRHALVPVRFDRISEDRPWVRVL